MDQMIDDDKKRRSKIYTVYIGTYIYSYIYIYLFVLIRIPSKQLGSGFSIVDEWTIRIPTSVSVDATAP